VTRTRPLGRRGLIACGLALVVVVSAILAVNRVRRPRPIPMLGPASATIVPGVHMMRGLGPSVAYVVETSAGPILIDTGLEADGAALQAEMAKFLLDWRSIRAVLITHVHGDHSGGAEHLRQAVGAKVYAGKGDSDVLRAGGPKVAFFSAFHMPNHTPHKTTVDVELNGGETLTFGDTKIEAIGTPGHTPGSICYLLEKGGRRILFSGDVIMHLGDEKPLGTYSAYLAPRYRGDAATYLATLRTLKAMKAPDLVLPGHPPLGDTPDDPRMTPERWSTMMDEGINDMEILRARYIDEGSGFLDDEPKEILKGLYYLGDLDGVSVYAMVVNSRLILIDAPGGEKLPAFVADRVRRLQIATPVPKVVLLTSCDADHTSGLKAIVEKTKAEVLAPRAGLEALKAAHPEAAVLPAESLRLLGLTDLRVIPLRVRGVASAAYVLIWMGKSVLISGSVPVKFGEEMMANLSSAPAGSREDALDALAALEELSKVEPSVWLPSAPWHGQNAYIYGREWKDILASNDRLEYYRLKRSEAPPPRSPSNEGVPRR
jgi:hydroxyacylglutathione hydrolase